VRDEGALATEQPRVIFKKVRPRQNNQSRKYTTESTKMAPYDSDSSDDGGDYTETNVLLGYAAKEATGDTISHIGGAPVRTSSTTPSVFLTTMVELDR
jgi:hypothetical protein